MEIVINLRQVLLGNPLAARRVVHLRRRMAPVCWDLTSFSKNILRWLAQVCFFVCSNALRLNKIIRTKVSKWRQIPGQREDDRPFSLRTCSCGTHLCVFLRSNLTSRALVLSFPVNFRTFRKSPGIRVLCRAGATHIWQHLNYMAPVCVCVFSINKMPRHFLVGRECYQVPGRNKADIERPIQCWRWECRLPPSHRAIQSSIPGVHRTQEAEWDGALWRWRSWFSFRRSVAAQANRAGGIQANRYCSFSVE